MPPKHCEAAPIANKWSVALASKYKGDQLKFRTLFSLLALHHLVCLAVPFIHPLSLNCRTITGTETTVIVALRGSNTLWKM